MPAPQLRIYCLGAFQATLDGIPVDFDADKARALLAYLAVESSRPHQRQRLAGLLWSDQPEEKALHSLRQTLSGLRKALGDDTANAGTPILLVQRESLQLNPECDSWLDVRQFQELLRPPVGADGVRPGTENTRAGANSIRPYNFMNPRRVQQAVALYRGPFLEQLYLNGSPLFEEWAVVLREACNQQACAALERLANYHERRGETALARQAALRMTELTPWDENAHTRLMHLYAQDALWSAAQNQYHSLRRSLSDELGLEIAPETRRLFDEIRRLAGQNQPLARRFPPAVHNLPASLTPFVGRETEQDRLSDLLAGPGSRLVVLLGPGGMGKTRLALQAAAAQVGLFADGVFFAPLESQEGKAETLQQLNIQTLCAAIAAALGFQFYSPRDLPGQLIDYLHGKDLLLLLDNFESLLAEGSGELTGFLADILKHAPAVRLLVTSRISLNLHSEHILELGGLSYPPAGEHNVGAYGVRPDDAVDATRADSIRPYEAIELFVQVARRANPALEMEAHWDSAAHICQMLEGAPLGIELAAAWTRQMLPAEIARQIETSLDFLATRMPDLPPRHRSMRAVFLHSWALLTEPEQAALSGLSVFHGGFSAQATAEIVGAASETLHMLQNKSLLVSPVPSPVSRISPSVSHLPSTVYRLHSLVRQFAAEQLALQPERQAALLDQHARFYSAFMAELNPDLRSQRQPQALEALSLESGNIRQAWLHLVSSAQADEMAACLDTLYNFYNIKSWFLEGVDLFTTASASLRASVHPISRNPYPVFFALLTRLAAFHIRLGQLDLAWEELEEAGAGWERLPIIERAMQRSSLCSWFLRRGKNEQALHAAGEVLQAYQQAGNENGIARAEMYLGTCHQHLGRMQEALQHLQASLDLCRRSGDPRLLLIILDRLAGLYSHFGDSSQALPCYTEALQTSRDLGDLFFQGMVANNLGALHQELAQYDQARACYQESLGICQKIGDRAGEALAICNLGEVDMLQGSYTQAIQHAEMALAMGREMEDSLTELSALCVIAETSIQQVQAARAREVALQGLRLASEDQNIEMLVRLAVALGGAFKISSPLSPGFIPGDQARQVLSAAIQHEACGEYHRQRAQAWLEELGGAAAGEVMGLEQMVIEILAQSPPDVAT